MKNVKITSVDLSQQASEINNTRDNENDKEKNEISIASKGIYKLRWNIRNLKDPSLVKNFPSFGLKESYKYIIDSNNNDFPMISKTIKIKHKAKMKNIKKEGNSCDLKKKDSTLKSIYKQETEKSISIIKKPLEKEIDEDKLILPLSYSLKHCNKKNRNLSLNNNLSGYKINSKCFKQRLVDTIIDYKNKIKENIIKKMEDKKSKFIEKENHRFYMNHYSDKIQKSEKSLKYHEIKNKNIKGINNEFPTIELVSNKDSNNNWLELKKPNNKFKNNILVSNILSQPRKKKCVKETVKIKKNLSIEGFVKLVKLKKHKRNVSTCTIQIKSKTNPISNNLNFNFSPEQRKTIL